MVEEELNSWAKFESRLWFVWRHYYTKFGFKI